MTSVFGIKVCVFLRFSRKRQDGRTALPQASWEGQHFSSGGILDSLMELSQVKFISPNRNAQVGTAIRLCSNQCQLYQSWSLGQNLRDETLTFRNRDETET